MSVSSEGFPPGEEDLDSDSIGSPTDELLGSQSRRWLADILAGNISDTNGNVNSVGRDGLFVDHHFPLGQAQLQASVQWRRPKELCPSPQFIVDGASRMDVHQGGLNDCWFLSALASLSLHRPLLEKVVPAGQSFQEGYNGSFCFRFWQYGQWEEVTVDDLLPTDKGQLIYLKSPEKHEFWSSLLEKAYAKLKGGYTALEMGFPHEAMVDLTGGVTEVWTTASLPRGLSIFISRLLAKGALINCANCQGPLNETNEQGIMFRHAYSLTGVDKVNTSYGPVELVRVHNPWGKAEWEGPWSDLNGSVSSIMLPNRMSVQNVCVSHISFSSLSLSLCLCLSLCLIVWLMTVSDFRQNFEVMEVCHLSDTLSQTGSRPWHSTMHHGTWVPGVSSGGPPEGGWFWQNPQFSLTLFEEDDDPSDPQKTCSFLVALMQKHQRRTGVCLAIGLHIYQARSEGKYLSSLDLSLLRPVLSSPGYTRRREVVLRGRLAPGHYVIIASTSEPSKEGAFILRVLTEKGNTTIPAEKQKTEDVSNIMKPIFPHLTALPSPKSTQRLFKKHCNKNRVCRPLDLHRLLTEAIQGGVLAGSERKLVLEHCKSLVVLMDTQGLAQLDWHQFKNLWDKITKWTDIFLTFDKNKSQQLEYPEVSPALKAAGITVDDFVIQLIGLRYTEPDMTISYPGFLYLLMKLDNMIQKFHAYDMAGMGSVSVSFRQWLHMTMYN
ncbi:calpain-9 [Polymixia lowei]